MGMGNLKIVVVPCIFENSGYCKSIFLHMPNLHARYLGIVENRNFLMNFLTYTHEALSMLFQSKILS